MALRGIKKSGEGCAILLSSLRYPAAAMARTSPTRDSRSLGEGGEVEQLLAKDSASSADVAHYPPLGHLGCGMQRQVASLSRSSRVEYTRMRMDMLCGCPGPALGRRLGRRISAHASLLGSSAFDARGMKWAGKGVLTHDPRSAARICGVGNGARQSGR
ncbi:hypothetical protein B0H13DRAFT_2523402 [Mycena leptocephala]|nr:hypothetical protein B0H13DRAFT_2523402 [Mycena leptocephala]